LFAGCKKVTPRFLRRKTLVGKTISFIGSRNDNRRNTPIPEGDSVVPSDDEDLVRISAGFGEYGVGVLPVGFTVHFGRNVVQPFFETHGGVIASTEPIPINALNSTGLNFLFDFGAGTRIRLDAHEAISVGYKFLHISNGYTTNFNPGVDNNVIFVGFSILR
jgi:hypothetical protein